ncbi:site-specific integrase [uncultured Phyllobacterium sp.]|uniref:tyrosine-type recombinase/integrase n=1 Tax=uncultured Phyllobacterium sp. TaxID=253813 RepID=UPI00258907D9|nr:site-specific integrase [uncultured Phyllobacterium sp.]
MPRKAQELGPLHIKRLVEPGIHFVGGVNGLQLQVKDTGARSWLLRVQIGNKRRHIGLGGYPDVTLAQARDRAREAHDKIRLGIDPVEERRTIRLALKAESTVLTFEEAASRWHKSKQHEYQNGKHADQVLNTLVTYAGPVIGTMRVNEINVDDIYNVLDPLWTAKTETATRLRGRIENVLAWATVSGYRTGENPARWKGNLDALMAKPGKLKKTVHHKALPIDQISDFLTALRKTEGMGSLALEFCILTATRSGEVRGATWDEIDFDKKVWTIPAERMKAGKEHRVPLSKAAIQLLRKVPRFQNSNFAFAAVRGGKISDMTISAVLRRMKIAAVPHGFRSTFRDWCSERTAYPNDVAEMALAHTIGNKVEAAYRRGDLFEKRVQMMEDWAIFCQRRKS